MTAQVSELAFDLAGEAVARGAQQKPAELAALVELVGRAKPRVVVEIGSAKGGTLYAWCRVAAPDALIVSIDLPGGDFGGGSTEEEAARFHEYAAPGQTLRLIRASSHDASTRDALERELAGRPVDFLFIDGDHTYDGVRADHETYAPIVRPGGLVAFHDIVVHPEIPSCEVDRYWGDLGERYEQLAFVEDAGGPWGGIGVLRGERRAAKNGRRADGPLVSVIVTSYNYARFVGATIESALRQTYPRTEVIVVDDGSTDGSRDVIGGYGDDLRAIFKPNGGQASAFNSGFAASRGDVVLFLDSDDLLLPRAAERAVAALAERGAVKAQWYLRTIDEQGALKGPIVPRRTLSAGELRDAAVAAGPQAYVWPPTSGNAWSRTFLETVLPVPEQEYLTCPDSYLAALAPVAGPVARINEALSLYRVHGRNNMNNVSYADRIRLFEQEASALAAFLGERGVEVDVQEWRERNSYYRWIVRMRDTSAELARAVPEGSRFLLVDDNELAGELERRRDGIPFLERGGEYWGAPTGDRQAIEELERMRSEGAEFAVFAWPCFWWLDYYKGFARHLRERYRCVFTSDRLVVFDLR